VPGLDEHAWLQMCDGLIDWDPSNIDDTDMYSRSLTDNATIPSAVSFFPDDPNDVPNAVSFGSSFVSPLTTGSGFPASGVICSQIGTEIVPVPISMICGESQLHVMVTTTFPLMDSSSIKSFEEKVMLKKYDVPNLQDLDYVCHLFRDRR